MVFFVCHLDDVDVTEGSVMAEHLNVDEHRGFEFGLRCDPLQLWIGPRRSTSPAPGAP